MTGNAAAAALGLITLALNARALGTAGLGVFALILALASLIERIAAFQTGLPLIKLGAAALTADDKPRVGQLVTVALLFDVIASMMASVGAVLSVLLAGEWLGLPPEYLGVAAIYMATLVTRITDAPTGIMRLFNRFGLLTSLRVCEAAGQCLAAGVLFLADAPLSAYILSFAALAVAANIALLASAIHVAVRNGASPVVIGLLAVWAAEWREFWSFSWLMSLLGTLDIIRDRVPVLLLGAFLGPSVVGLYHIAQRFAAILSMINMPFSLALYPEAARLSSIQRYEDLQWLTLRIAAVSGTVGLAALGGTVGFGEVLIRTVFGPGYQEAYWPTVFLIGSYCFAMAGVGLNSAILVTSGPKALLRATLLPFLVFALFLAPVTAQWGLWGAAAAQILFWFMWLVVSVIEFKMWLRRPRAGNTGTERI